jgi:hypothetical protein
MESSAAAGSHLGRRHAASPSGAVSRACGSSVSTTATTARVSTEPHASAATRFVQASIASSALTPIRVLVADESAISRHVTALMLKRLGVPAVDTRSGVGESPGDRPCGRFSGSAHASSRGDQVAPSLRSLLPTVMPHHCSTRLFES